MTPNTLKMILFSTDFDPLEQITILCRRLSFLRKEVVVLPDHLHCLWTLPPTDADYPTRWRLIKTWVAQRYRAGSSRPIIRTLWQARYWEHLIRDDRDFRQHVEYIHYNPVKHGYVRKPGAWPYSRARIGSVGLRFANPAYETHRANLPIQFCQ